MSRGEGKSRSQRQLRVGEELRHILARVLNADLARDPDLDGVNVTVSEVRISPDLKNATAFVLPLGGADAVVVTKALNRAAPFFRHAVAREIDLRYTPRLSFQIDRSFDEADRIGKLLRGQRVQRDLQAEDEGSEDDASS